MPKMSPVKIQQPKFHKKRAFVSDICSCCVRRLLTGFQQNVFQPYLFTQDSIMSLDMSLSRLSRCLANSSSGQCRSLMNVCSASSFQNKSSEVPEPLLPMQKRQSEGDTESYFTRSWISGMECSGKGQEAGRSEGRGLLKKTKPVSSPGWHIWFTYFLPLPDRCRVALTASDQPHWRSFHGKK